jgi:hypothetical protein
LLENFCTIDGFDDMNNGLILLLSSHEKSAARPVGTIDHDFLYQCLQHFAISMLTGIDKRCNFPIPDSLVIQILIQDISQP